MTEAKESEVQQNLSRRHLKDFVNWCEEIKADMFGVSIRFLQLISHATSRTNFKHLVMKRDKLINR